MLRRDQWQQEQRVRENVFLAASALDIHRERWQGTLDLLLIAPVRWFWIALGRSLAILAASCLSLAVITPVAGGLLAGPTRCLPRTGPWCSAPPLLPWLPAPPAWGWPWAA